jgi:hypothetical protein
VEGAVIRGILALLLVFVAFPVVSSAQGDPPILLNYEPPVGIAEYTKIYVTGYNFGSAPGTLTIGGMQIPADHIAIWSDAEIVATVPAGAATGPIVVTTTNGSDSSTVESSPDSEWGWSGTGGFNANFSILTPTEPPLLPLSEYPQPCGCDAVNPEARPSAVLRPRVYPVSLTFRTSP